MHFSPHTHIEGKLYVCGGYDGPKQLSSVELNDLSKSVENERPGI